METNVKKDIIHYLRTKDLTTLAKIINSGISAEQLKGYVGKLGNELLGEDGYSKLLYELDEEFESKLDEPFYDWVNRQDGWSLLTPELENIVRRKEWLTIDPEWDRDRFSYCSDYYDDYDYYYFEWDTLEEQWLEEFDDYDQGMFIEDLYYIG